MAGVTVRASPGVALLDGSGWDRCCRARRVTREGDGASTRAGQDRADVTGERDLTARGATCRCGGTACEGGRAPDGVSGGGRSCTGETDRAARSCGRSTRRPGDKVDVASWGRSAGGRVAGERDAASRHPRRRCCGATRSSDVPARRGACGLGWPSRRGERAASGDVRTGGLPSREGDQAARERRARADRATSERDDATRRSGSSVRSACLERRRATMHRDPNARRTTPEGDTATRGGDPDGRRAPCEGNRAAVGGRGDARRPCSECRCAARDDRDGEPLRPDPAVDASRRPVAPVNAHSRLRHLADVHRAAK